jgi:hypothetical protein
MNNYPSRQERVPGTYSETNMLDQAIAKYGGKDEQYKLALKKNVQGYLGYANYVRRMNQVDTPNSPMTLPSGAMTPSGAAAAGTSANNNQLKELEYLKSMASYTGTVGDAVASSSLADLKAGVAKGDKSLFMDISKFQPLNDTEASLQSLMRNPFLPGGVAMDAEMIRKRLTDDLVEEGSPLDVARAEVEKAMDTYMPNNTKTSTLFQDNLKKLIKTEHPTATQSELDWLFAQQNQVLPENLQYQWNKYLYQSWGRSEAQAEADVTKDNYANDKMSLGERIKYEQDYPNEVKEVQLMKNTPGLKDDLRPKTFADDTTGLQLSFGQLVDKYSAIAPTVLKQMALPVYTNELSQDIDLILSATPPAENADGKTLTLPSFKALAEEVTTTDSLATTLKNLTDTTGSPDSDKFNVYMDALAEDYAGLFTANELKSKARTRLMDIMRANIDKYNKIRVELKTQNPNITYKELEAKIAELQQASSPIAN